MGRKKTEKQYLLLLFFLGVAAKGLVKSTFGSNVSIALLLGIGLYYWRTKRRSETIYDDIARKQLEAAAKLDALHGVGDGKVPEMAYAVRKTHFQLEAADVGIVTDRMHKYSRMLGGTRADRQKFLRKNRKKRADEIDINDPSNQEQSETIASKAATSQVQEEKKNMERIVEEAINETL